MVSAYCHDVAVNHLASATVASQAASRCKVIDRDITTARVTSLVGGLLLKDISHLIYNMHTTADIFNVHFLCAAILLTGLLCTLP